MSDVYRVSTIRPILSARPMRWNYLGAAVITGLLWTGAFTASAQVQMDDMPPDDPDAMLFVNSCLNCHKGVTAGTELINTHSRSLEALKTAVTRMQQYTGPLKEEQIDALVDLLHDPDYKFRIDEARLLKLEEEAAIIAAGGDNADIFAQLFVAKCAACHTVSGGFSSGGDLAKTATWQIPQLKTAVKAMESRVGPLTDEQVNGLTELLKDREVKKRLVSAGMKLPVPGETTPQPAGATGLPQSTFQIQQTPQPKIPATMTEAERAERLAELEAHKTIKPKKVPARRLVTLAILAVLAIIGVVTLFRLEKKH